MLPLTKMTWYDTIDMKTDSWCPVGRRVGRGVAQKSLFVHGGIIWLQ